MPKVMMIRGVPAAGSYRPPMGRVVPLGYMPNMGTPGLTVRRPAPVLGYMPHPGAASLHSMMRVPTPAGLRLGALGRQLGRAGLRGMCDDDGWTAVNALMTGVGTGIVQGSQGVDAQGNATTDRGQAAVGAGLTAAAAAYRQLCAAQATGQGAAGDPTAADTMRREMELERLRYQMEGQVSMAQQNAATSAAAAARQQETMKWVGIGVAGLVGLGLVAWVFKGKRRR